MHFRFDLAGVLVLVALPAWFAIAQQPSQIGASISDRDKAGLRGPVKTMAEGYTTTKYAPDGRILELRSGAQIVMNYTYYPDGRLWKIGTGTMGLPSSWEKTYLYDEAGRLAEVKTSDGKGVRYLRYQYDDNGHKSSIEHFDSGTAMPAVVSAWGDPTISSWQGTRVADWPRLGFILPHGGNVTTSYNEQGVATGAQFHDAEGTLVGHIVRRFDGEGRISGEEQTADAPAEFPFPEWRSKLTPEQINATGTLIAAEDNTVISYSYDDKGREVERHRSRGFEDQVTITEYNDHGDTASERNTTVMNPDTGPWQITEAGALIPSGKQNPPQPPLTHETQYTYQYDEYGNWTEQTIAGRSNPNEAFQPGKAIRRNLTYY